MRPIRTRQTLTRRAHVGAGNCRVVLLSRAPPATVVHEWLCLDSRGCNGDGAPQSLPPLPRLRSRSRLYSYHRPPSANGALSAPHPMILLDPPQRSDREPAPKRPRPPDDADADADP